MGSFYGTLAAVVLALDAMVAALLTYVHQSVSARVPDSAMRGVVWNALTVAFGVVSVVLLVATLALGLLGSLPTDRYPSAGQVYATSTGVAVMIVGLFFATSAMFVAIVAKGVSLFSPRGLMRMLAERMEKLTDEDYAKGLSKELDLESDAFDDPIGALTALGADAARRGDVGVWKAVVRTVAGLAHRRTNPDWNEEIAGLVAILHLRSLTEDARSSGKPGLIVYCINAVTAIVSEAVGKKSHHQYMRDGTSYLRDVFRDGLAEQDDALCAFAAEALEKIASDASAAGHNNAYDDACRALGWLGERAARSQQGGGSTRMPNRDEVVALEELVEALLKVAESTIKDHHAEIYPIVLVDAIECVALAVIEGDEKREPIDRRRDLVDGLLGELESLGVVAATRGRKMAWVCAMKMVRWYKKLGTDYSSLRNSLVSGVVAICAESVGVDPGDADAYEPPADSASDLASHLLGYLRDLDPSEVAAAIEEHHIRSTGTQDSWPFVVRAGRVLESNFGLMFDWRTGERYPPDDPRRRG